MVPATVEIATEVMADKYKRRSVSGIRRFPKGCGRHAPPLTAGPEPGKLSAPEIPVANGTVVLETVVAPKQEPKDLAGHSESLEPEKVDAAEVAGQVEAAESQGRIMANGTAELLAVEMSKAEPDELRGPSGSSQPEKARDISSANSNHVEAGDVSKTAIDLHTVKGELEEVNDADSAVKLNNLEVSEGNSILPDFLSGFDTGVSKLYGPSKRRNVSVIRHFPSGCGRNAAPMTREGCPRRPTVLYNETAVFQEPTGQQRVAVVGVDGQVGEMFEDHVVRENQESTSKISLDSRAMEESRRKKIPAQEATKSKEKFAKVRKEKNIKSQSWKHLETEEEVSTRNAKLPSEKSMSLDVRADTIIVQALMAARNCPWRQGRQIGMVPHKTTISGNKAKKEVSTPKRKSLSFETSLARGNNAKKEVRIPKKKRLSFEASFHQPENKPEDGEDSLLEDVGDDRALVIYPGTKELSVSVPPFGPSDSNHDVGCSEEAAIRIRVRKALRLFQVLCRKILQGEESKPKNQGQKVRVDLAASSILKEKNEWVNTGKPIVGSVPGVEVGDEFHYRAELCVVGLHRSYQSGIDFSKLDGILLAISIVASVGHADEMDSSDVLIYSGSGGSAAEGDKPPQDQKLERGNLALKNCIDAKTPVRVIRGIKELRSSGAQDGKQRPFSTFTYDGLYLVEDHWLQKSPQGFSVYKFKLRRIPGQPEIALKEVKRSKRSAVREGLCIADISEGKEKIPISVVNTVDDERPAHFEYVTKMIYPSRYTKTPPEGCDCKKRCSDSENCACAVKNGGEIPFNFNGAIVQAKPLVYECGPSCNCPPSCHNRVSQHGIKIRLEIFKTKSRGWGVRSLSSIPSGSFICEYIGELIGDKEAEQSSNDEYLFDIGHNYDDHDLWEGLPTLIPDSQSSSPGKDVGKDHEVGFTIDAAKYGNVGRFINHSCSPNLYAQNVLYDHDDKKMPHIMLFAAENIPPLQELTYHYNYKIDQVRDSDGNIKTKACHCGSHECTGRLY